jgi:ketosteroid isomerase-like protein
MKNIIILALLFIAASAVAQNSSKEKDVKALKDLSIQWMDAWRTKDSVKLEQILAPDYRLVFAAPTVQIVPRSKWMQVALHGYDCESFKYLDFDIRVYGNTAIVQSTYEQKAVLNGTDRSGKFMITDVWVKTKGQWQVVHRHTSFGGK